MLPKVAFVVLSQHDNKTPVNLNNVIYILADTFLKNPLTRHLFLRSTSPRIHGTSFCSLNLSADFRISKAVEYEASVTPTCHYAEKTRRLRGTTQECGLCVSHELLRHPSSALTKLHAVEVWVYCHTPRIKSRSPNGAIVSGAQMTSSARPNWTFNL